MDIYYIKGLRSLSHAKEVKEFFKESTHHSLIDIDYQHQLLFLDDDIDINDIKRAATFEQVTILDFDVKKHHIKDQYDYYLAHYNHIEEDIPDHTTKNMFVVLWLNLLFSICEFIFGHLFNSTAILSDAIHDFGDALAIAIAWVFQKISAKGPDHHFSFGYRRFSLLGALVTSVVLIVSSIALILHTLPKIFYPEPVNYNGMFWLSLFAIGISGFSAWILKDGHSHNEKVLNLHLLEDLLGWIAVLIASVIVRFTHWYMIDPLLSLGIAIWIITHALKEFFEIGQIFLQAVPHQINQGQIMDQIQSVPGVKAMSHLHIWSMEGQTHFATVTIETNANQIHELEEIKNHIRYILAQYDITHITIEMIAVQRR